MIGDEAMEFLKTLHKLDGIWKKHDDAEYNKEQLTQFAERYHANKKRELLIDFLSRKPMCHHHSLNDIGIKAYVDKYLK